MSDTHWYTDLGKFRDGEFLCRITGLKFFADKANNRILKLKTECKKKIGTEPDQKFALSLQFWCRIPDAVTDFADFSRNLELLVCRD